VILISNVMALVSDLNMFEMWHLTITSNC